MRVRWLWLLLLLIPVLVMPAAALDGWLYYRDITISNSLDQELTNYQVKIVLDTYSLILGGKMRSDCGDIRFTDTNDTLLPYWIEPETCNNQNTVIWVKVPSIPANGQTTIRLWYGNSSAESLSNVSSVFIAQIPNATAVYLFNEGSGNVLYDRSGNNNNGTIYNAVWVDTERGKALYFDGNAYVVIPDSPTLNPVNEISIIAWVKLTAPLNEQGTYASVVYKYYTETTPFKGYHLQMRSNDNRTMFAIRDQNGNMRAAYFQDLPADTEWHFVAGTYDGNKQTLYLDELSTSIFWTGTISESSTNLGLGTGGLKGIISLLMLFNKDLTADEINIIRQNDVYATPKMPQTVLIKKFVSLEPNINIGSETVILPDLTAADISTSAPIAVQQPFNVNVKVKNTGNKPAGSFKVGIYVDNSKIAEQTVSSLDTDEEVQLSFSITINQPGNHIIKAMADIYNEVEEISEANNEVSVLRYVAAPDFTITKLEVSPQLNVIVGRSVTITATVANLGDASVSSVRVLTTVKLNNETQYSEERRVSLAPQQNTELTFTFTPVKNGTHVIEVIIDPDNRFIEHNENNNAATASIEVGGLPFRTPTPPPVGGKTFREIYEPLTLRTYNLPLEAMSLIAVLGISVVGYGFGVFRGTVNFFFLSVVYFIVSTFLGWSMFIAAGLLAVATMLLVVTVAFIRED